MWRQHRTFSFVSPWLMASFGIHLLQWMNEWKESSIEHLPGQKWAQSQSFICNHHPSIPLFGIFLVHLGFPKGRSLLFLDVIFSWQKNPLCNYRELTSQKELFPICCYISQTLTSCINKLICTVLIISAVVWIQQLMNEINENLGTSEPLFLPQELLRQLILRCRWHCLDIV